MKPYLHLLLLAAALLWPGLAGAATPRYPYLVRASAEITQIDHGSAELSAADAARIAKVACEALSSLLEDPNFRSDLDRLRTVSPEAIAKARALRDDLADFTQTLRRYEYERLREEGIDPAFTGLTLWNAAAIRDQIKPPADAAQLQAKVAQLRNGVCRLSEQRIQMLERERIKLMGFQIAAGFGGAVLIAVDAATTAASAGATSPMAALSAAAAVPLLDYAAKALPGNG